MNRYKKYKNRKVYISDEKFDSEKEARRYKDLLKLQKAGVISGLRRQVKYVLIPTQHKDGKTVRECSYYADFVYTWHGETIVEDVKGYKGGEAYALFTIKKKLMLYVHGIEIKEV